MYFDQAVNVSWYHGDLLLLKTFDEDIQGLCC